MFKQIAAAAALVIASSSAIAQEAPKFYVGGEFSSSEYDGSDRESGFGGFVGYKFNQNIAVEAGYNRLAKIDGVKLDQTIISVVGALPLSNGFNLFGRLGYNDLKANFREDGVSGSVKLDDGVVYGAGIGYDFSPVVSGRLEVQKPVSEVTKIAAGVSFHF
jgi:OOP family OmpA-OmpF porin